MTHILYTINKMDVKERHAQIYKHNKEHSKHIDTHTWMCSIAFFPIQTEILTKFNIGRRIFFQIMNATCVCVLFCFVMCVHMN